MTRRERGREILDRKVVLPHLLATRAVESAAGVLMQEVAGRTITNAQMYESTLRWADVLRSHGIGVGDTVLTMLPNGLDAYCAWLGAAWLRSIEVPINTMYRGRMLRHVIEDSRAATMVVSERYLPELLDVAAEVKTLQRLIVVGATGALPNLPWDTSHAARVLADASAESVSGLPGPEYYDIATMIYTSGTTGQSKGVLMPWRELYEFVVSMPEDMYTAGRGTYSVLPAYHVSGKLALWAASLFGCRLVVRELFSVKEFWSDVKRFDCTSTGLIGSMAGLLLRQPPHPDEANSPLRRLALGPVIPELDNFRARFGVDVTTGFGMTEIGVPLAVDGWAVPNCRTCGRPRPGYEVRVVDVHDEPLGPQRVGELVVRTAEPWMLNAGYWRMPEATAAAWRNGWFHTGDAMSYDEDGNFYFVDRIKDAIRRRGENISSFEVEAYVTDHPAVAECAAIAVPAEVTEDDVKIVVVRMPGAEIGPAELHKFLVERMPKFMVPRYVEFTESLPKTQTQRVQKAELRKDALNASTWDRETAVAS